MFHPPTIPINAISFSVLSICWGLFSYVIFQKYDSRNPNYLVWHSMIGLLGGIVSLGVLTAISYIPNDWNACRLSWSAGILYGYPLYAGESGPSNGFFYPPVGAWFYVPAAALGIYFKSPQVSLVAGWLMSLSCILLPFGGLIYRLKDGNGSKFFSPTSLLCLLIVVGFTFALPQTRYLATMVHVDSPGFLFLALSLILLVPIKKYDESVSNRLLYAGIAFAISSLTKQSIWPGIPVVGFGLVIFYGFKKSMIFLVGAFTGVILICICFYFSGESFNEAYKMVWSLPIKTPSVVPVQECLLQFINCNLSLLIMYSLLLVFSCFFLKIEKCYIKVFIYFAIVGLWYLPFAIFTKTKGAAADVNHLAFPSLFLLLSLVVILFSVFNSSYTDSKNNKLLLNAVSIQVIVILLLSYSMIPYFKSYCGWYLWLNNSHSQAFGYENYHQLNRASPKLYFPWQVFSTLIATGKLYHIDDCLRYEEAAGWRRSNESLKKYLPQEPFKIGLRPFGAPSYLAEKMGFQKCEQDLKFSKRLPNWIFYEPVH